MDYYGISVGDLKSSCTKGGFILSGVTLTRFHCNVQILILSHPHTQEYGMQTLQTFKDNYQQTRAIKKFLDADSILCNKFTLHQVKGSNV